MAGIVRGRGSQRHRGGLSRLGWSRARLLLTVAVGGYLFASLFPFWPELPRRVDNGAARQDDGLAFVAPGMVTLPDQLASSVVEAAAVRIELVVETDRADQAGPARILALSSGAYAQDLMLGQSGSDLVVRVRRPGADEIGMPGITVARLFQRPGPHRIVVAIGPEQDTVEADGERIATEPADGTDRWDPAHRFVLGNEHGGDRPWLGRIESAVVETPDRAVDLLALGDLPDEYWRIPARLQTQPPWYRVWNTGPVALLHGLALIAIGLLGVRAVPNLRPLVVTRRCWALSAVTLVAKFAVLGRHPKLSDLGIELAGAAIGVGIGVLLVRD